MFLILKKLGFDWAANLFHLSYGMVELPSGKMKSREGTVVDADDLMEEILIFCRHFVFSNFSSKYSVHFAFHIRSSFLDYLWISLLSFLRPFVSLVSPL